MRKMKRCRICFEDLYEEVSLLSYFSYEDIICEKCRYQMNAIHTWKQIEELEVFYLYAYDSYMESLLFQFKEGRDIALKDVFFYKDKKRIEKMFKGYTIIYMPSSVKHTKQRGFFPLEEMLRDINLPKYHYFEKTREYKQSSKSYDKRKEVAQIIRVREECIPLKDKILLVDDVCTSGETLLCAYKLIQKEGREIKALVLCDNHTHVELCDEKKFPFIAIPDILKKEKKRREGR